MNLVQRAAVGFAERGDVRPGDEPAEARHFGPAPGPRVRPGQRQGHGVDAVGADENVADCGLAVRQSRRHAIRGLLQRGQPAVHVNGNRARLAAVGAEFVHTFIEAHQQVQPVHVMEPGSVAHGGHMIERPFRHAAVLVELA